MDNKNFQLKFILSKHQPISITQFLKSIHFPSTPYKIYFQHFPWTVIYVHPSARRDPNKKKPTTNWQIYIRSSRTTIFFRQKRNKDRSLQQKISVKFSGLSFENPYQSELIYRTLFPDNHPSSSKRWVEEFR